MPKHTRAFTLIELLVVVGIIAVLVAILIPSLARARTRTKITVCLSNLSQVAKGALLYETDWSRFPTHLNELDPASFPNTIASFDGTNAHDTRKVWAPYVNVDYMNCPMIAKWSPASEPFLSSPNFNINVEYVLVGGYFGDGNDTVGFTSRYVRSSAPWTYNGRTLRALAGDRSYYSPAGSTTPASPLYRTFDNHADSRRKFALRISAYPRPVGRGFYMETPTPDDARVGGTLNFAFIDGSASTFAANASQVIQVKDRNSTTVGPKTDYLVPAE
jgi:prepilin-type N-terminal cleavage/methylation domain-containing protein